MLFQGALGVFSLLLTLGVSTVKAQIPVVPAQDPFYQPPAGFESKAPGSILRTRTVNLSFLGLIPDLSVQAYQLLYRTNSINGSAIAGVTTVFKPLIAKNDRFVSFRNYPLSFLFFISIPQSCKIVLGNSSGHFSNLPQLLVSFGE